MIQRFRWTRGGVALLLCAAAGQPVAQTRPEVPSNASDYARSQYFEYNSDGTLKSSTIERDNAALCVTSSFGYDAYGNITSTTTQNCAGAQGRAVIAARSPSTAFAAVAAQGITTGGSLTPNATVAIPAGLVATSTTNALSQIEYSDYDPRFGRATQYTDANSLVQSVLVDDFGRVIKEVRVDGTSALTWYCYLSSGGRDTTSNTVIGTTACPTPTAAEIPALAVRFTYTESRDTNGTKMSAFVRTYFDQRGRRIRSATESFDGANQLSTRKGAIVVSDVVFDAFGGTFIETTPYFLSSGSTSTTGSNDVGATMYTYDELGRISANYVADTQADASHSQVFGGSGGVSYGVYGSRLAATTTFTYTGTSTQSTNEAGQVRTEERNARGELVRVTDANGAQVAYLPDAFGNVVKVRDALQNEIASVYDFRGRKVQISDPDKGVIVYCLDVLGQIKAQQNSTMRGSHVPVACPNNNDSQTTATAVAGWTTFAYDKSGRTTHRVEPEFDSKWTYDKYADASACNMGVGRLCESATGHGLNKKFAYDNMGRVKNTRMDVFGGPSFATAVGYSTVTGRLVSRTFPSGLRAGYTYTALGYLSTLTTKTALTVNPLPDANGQVAAGTTLPVDSILWRANDVDAVGRIEEEYYSSGVIERTTYLPDTGRVGSIKAGVGTATNVLSHQYDWDGVGNLSTRIDNNGDAIAGAVSESFSYDGLNRLKQYTVTAPGIPAFERTVDLQFNALGMLLYKTDVGNYAYGASGSSAIQPHAIRSLSGNALTSYTADLNGNIGTADAGKYRKLTYSSFDNVVTAANASGATSYTWKYDENHARVSELRAGGGNSRTLWYLHPDNAGALSFEYETDTSPSATSNRHFITAGSDIIGVLVSDEAIPSLTSGQMAPTFLSAMSVSKVEYWHKDHLGSIASTTDVAGTVTQRYSYDPFGKRRYATGDYDEFGNVVVDWNPRVNYGTGRGFTGHEHLDDIGLVNMNGRVYDGNLGLFVQADPHVTAPNNLQNYNRYGYVLNNPLNATDPSGFDWNQEGGSYPGDYGANTWGLGSLLLAEVFKDLLSVGGSYLPIGNSNGTVNDSSPGPDDGAAQKVVIRAPHERPKKDPAEVVYQHMARDRENFKNVLSHCGPGSSSQQCAAGVMQYLPAHIQSQIAHDQRDNPDGPWELFYDQVEGEQQEINDLYQAKLADSGTSAADILKAQFAVSVVGGKVAARQKPAVSSLRRPYVRKATRKAVEKAALRDAQGRPIDPNTGRPIEGKPDLGHKFGNENWREKKQAEAEGLSQGEFNDRMNDPQKYQLEDPSSNRSHRYEKKD